MGPLCGPNQPTQMLAVEAPLALLLYEQYNRLAMSNMRLGDAAVSALMSYIEEETARLQAPHPNTGNP